MSYKIQEMCEDYNKQIDSLRTQFAKAQKQIKRMKLDLEIEKLAMDNVINTIGGCDYEGNPTSRINFLQRLRILLNFENNVPKLEDLLRIRCLKHRDVPQHNRNENNTGECGGCILEQLSDAVAAIKTVREHEDCYQNMTDIQLELAGIDEQALGRIKGHRCAASVTDEYWEKYHKEEK